MELIKKYLLELLDQLENGQKTPEQVETLSKQLVEALEAVEQNSDQAKILISQLGLKS